MSRSLSWRGDRLQGEFRVCAGREPECRLGWRVSCDVGAVMAWSGRRGQGADAGEDLVEQVVSRWEAQGELAAVTDQPGRYPDQSVSQGGDHGLAAADTVAEQPGARAGRSELVQPAGDAGREQRTPHPGGVDLRVSGREGPQGGPELGVAEHVLDRGPVPV